MKSIGQLEIPVASDEVEVWRRSAAAEEKPFLLADWDRALFLHFEIDPDAWQSRVPFTLDLFEGRAFVSLVAFTMRRMRLARGGRVAELLFVPVAEQRFLNLRAYVRHGQEHGIYFITEWMSHWLCVQLGPLLYGLPYRWGRLEFCHAPEQGQLHGRIEARDGSGGLSYSASIADGDCPFAAVAAGSLDEFLLERYTAFTCRGAIRRRFRVNHRPWRQARVEVAIGDESLLLRSTPCWKDSRLVAAHYSPGAIGIGMGPPRRLN